MPCMYETSELALSVRISAMSWHGVGFVNSLSGSHPLLFIEAPCDSQAVQYCSSLYHSSSRASDRIRPIHHLIHQVTSRPAQSIIKQSFRPRAKQTHLSQQSGSGTLPQNGCTSERNSTFLCRRK